MVAGALLMAGLIVGLVVFYLTRPYFRRINLSASRFVQPSPANRAADRRFSLRSLLLSPPFYLQLLVLVIALLAFLLPACRDAGATTGIALAVAIDTSASMTTTEGDATRYDLALAEADRLAAALTQLPAGQLTCLEAYAFDDERRPLGATTPGALPALLAGVAPRPLPTDLPLLRSLAEPVEGHDCPLTHLIVLTDQPAPEWVEKTPLGANLIWRGVGQPVTNVGLLSLEYTQAVQFGGVGNVLVEVAAYAADGPPATTTLRITDPSGQVWPDRIIDWAQPGSNRLLLSPTVSGRYRLELVPGDAYAYDDMALIDVEIPEGVRVDWRLSDRTFPDAMGWRLGDGPVDLRVVGYVADPPTLLGRLAEDVPTLIVGDAYRRAPSPARVDFFVEAHPLLADLNFDVAESLAIAGVSLAEETQLDPVLAGDSGPEPRAAVWLAVRQSPPAAYVPGLPDNSDPNLGAFSLTVFLNAVRWLLQAREPAALFTPTTTDQPEPAGTRLALHRGEGDTARPADSVGDFTDLRPGAVVAEGSPVWPMIVALLAVVLLIERALAALGGSAWR